MTPTLTMMETLTMTPTLTMTETLNNDDRDAMDGDKVAAECACAKRVCVRGKA